MEINLSVFLDLFTTFKASRSIRYGFDKEIMQNYSIILYLFSDIFKDRVFFDK